MLSCPVLKDMSKKIFAVILSFLFLLPIPVFAEDRVPDLKTQTANLTISFVYTQEDGSETGIEGAEFNVYKAATLTTAGGSVEWQTQEPYRQFVTYEGDRESTYNGLDADDSISLAKEMAEVPNENVYRTGATDRDGKINLEIKQEDFGMYLVVQTKEAMGYEKTDPFLVSVPEAEGDPLAWNYQVTVSPKKAVTKITTPTPTGQITPVPSPTGTDKSGDGMATGDQMSPSDLLLQLVGTAGLIVLILINAKPEKEEMS